MSQRPIILSDESVNCYGFRVLTNGIQIENFLKNPVMFYNHDQKLLPIGKWVDVKKENGRLIGIPHFDISDPFASQVKSKYEQDILNAASIGFEILEISEDPKYYLPDQTRATVTKSEISEVSIAAIPANKNAVKLHFASKGVTLSGSFSSDILSLHIPNIHNLNSSSMVSKIAKAISLKALKYYQNTLERYILTKRKALELEGIKDLYKQNEMIPELLKESKDLIDVLLEMEKLSVISHSEEYVDSTDENWDEPSQNLSFSDWEKKDHSGLKKMFFTQPEKFKSLLENQLNYKLTDSDMRELNISYGGDGFNKPKQSIASDSEKDTIRKLLNDTPKMTHLAKNNPQVISEAVKALFPDLSNNDIEEYINILKNL